ncbi:MAG: phosphotransferase [Deltaproteobacteria bacterium]|nr:phosphotransferase [Deltaproteobacteria bacterium]
MADRVDAQKFGPFAAPLARLAASRATYFGSAWTRLLPGAQRTRATSRILELDVAHGARRGTAFLKVAIQNVADRRERARAMRNLLDDYVHQERAHAALPGSVARPIACFPEALAVVTEGAEGDTLATLLGRARWRGQWQELQLTFARAGAWLAAFHASGRADERISLARLRVRVDTHLRKAAGTQDRRRALRRFDGLAALVRSRELRAVPLHGDFSLENIVASGDRVTILDFDVSGGAVGTWLHDVAYLYAALARHAAKPWAPRRELERLQRALLRGLDPRLTPERPLFQLMLLVHAASGLFDAETWSRNPLQKAWNQLLWRPYRAWLGL